MKLKPQPARPKRSAASGARRAVRATPVGRGRHAKRPGVSLRRRVGARMPSLRRLIAGVGAVAVAAVLIALLNGPWLRVTDVAWAGDRHTDDGALAAALESQRGASLLTVDTLALADRLERLPSVASASVSAEMGGTLSATVTERQAAFVWTTRGSIFLGAEDGMIFAGQRRDGGLPAELEGLPRVRDDRFAARLVTVGDVIPGPLLRAALSVTAIDPLALGSDADRLSVRLDDEFGFRLVSTDPAWEVALGVFGIDPRETAAEADERLERQIAAVRTLFAEQAETGIGWVDVRNPGKVYFRAKG
jgi:cell division protein FtsQ